jgi:hypothetical protein
MVIPQHLLLIPRNIAEKPLQPADCPPSDTEGHRLNRFPFERTQLADHIVKKMRPRLTPGKTVVKGGLELPQFVHEAFHIAGHEIKRRDGKALMIGPTGW